MPILWISPIFSSVVGHHRCETNEELVQHQQSRPQHHAADREHLLLAAAHGTCELLPALGERGRS